MKFRTILWIGMGLLGAAGVPAEAAELTAVCRGAAPALSVALVSDGTTLLEPVAPGVALRLVQPGGTTEIGYRDRAAQGDTDFELLGGQAPGLSIREQWRRLTPQLWERQVIVAAEADARYFLDLRWRTAVAGSLHAFEGQQTESRRLALGFAGPSFGDPSLATFPLLGVRHQDSFVGIVGDTPGKWENRCWLEFDVEAGELALQNGDGSPRRVVTIPIALDATTVYRGTVDGWQHIEAGQQQVCTTWHYLSKVDNQYDIQLSAHLALANAQGFCQSALEAILRNTSYLLLRRNLLRPESDYLFISGVGYGWKQWVSDGFWMSRGLDRPEYDHAAHAAVFFDRINYEDNAQYYMIWSHLVRQTGGELDPRTLSRTYQFLRAHDQDGFYVPPRLVHDRKNCKTYHDQLEYEDDDAPSSNQGFHCGALMAARELGFGVTPAEIDRAKAAYARMFNERGGYFATSLLQQDHVGQDSLYGAVLTFAVFGEKILPDELVRRHLETTMRIQSPHGMRVISQANGDLLEGHSGVYVFGGSWFLNDAANYLCGLIHGMDSAWLDEQLLWRLEKELASMPAFHESISTVTGKPHGHHLYSWNSGFWWLRREVRRQLGRTGPDPLEAQLDQRLGVQRRHGYLVLEPGSGDLQRP